LHALLSDCSATHTIAVPRSNTKKARNGNRQTYSEDLLIESDNCSVICLLKTHHYDTYYAADVI
jgi:hypothetical protein